MPKHSQPRRGSMQFWPRKRARKILPSVNWRAVKVDKKGILGFIGYKTGMASCLVKDNTDNSMTKGQKIIIPATIIECPPIKILSVRFYKDGKRVKEIFIGGDKELKRRIKLSKKKQDKIELDIKEDYDSIRLIVYSIVNKTNIKKTPDIAEVGIGGSKEEQLEAVKTLLNKEILINEVFGKEDKLVDIRGLTTGRGLQGPAKRFGIGLRHHKSEKGVRKVGSIGPWHPARIMSTVPMAGQLGFFSRVVYNGKIIFIGKIAERNINRSGGFKGYGDIKSSYLILKGSVQGPKKRQILLTAALRPTKKLKNKNYEFLEVIK